MIKQSNTQKEPKLMKIPRSVRRLFPNVTRYQEAKRPLDVSVTRPDLVGAKRKEGDSCVMARAACRQEMADGAVIGLSYSYLIRGNTVTKYLTTPAVAREITSFDRSSKFAPGEYRLSSIPPSQKRSAQKKSQAARKARPVVSGPKNQRRVVHKETLNVRSFRRAA